MIEELDEKDVRILEVLRQNCKLSTQKISKKTTIPITTIYNRIKKMEDSGIIKRYTVEVDNKKLGKVVLAYIMLSVDYKLLKQVSMSQHELAKKVKQHPFVEEIDLITGEWDICIKVRVGAIDELDEFVTKYLRNIDGVRRTHTTMVLSEV